MEQNVGNAGQTGQNRLEQVFINMPEVRFYFSGDREQTGENLAAYLGSEALELRWIERFSQTGESIRYYVLLDVSASIRAGEFDGITQALADFAGTLRPQDQMAFLTFGEEVEVLFDLTGEELAKDKGGALIRGLENTDQYTLLFEAIQKAAEDAGSLTGARPARRVFFVVTDGEDIAKGMATKEEALETLQRSSIPVYGFTVADAKQDAVNAFGEFSRTTGGCLTILGSGEEKESFESVRQEILDSYEAVFAADSNRVSHETVSAVLEFTAQGEKRQRSVMQDRWIQDTEAPVVTEVSQEGARQIRVLFSEPVEGAEAAENFRLEGEQGAVVPAYASPGSAGDSVVLTFSEDLAKGDYDIVCENIRDRSMERNALESQSPAGSLQVEGTEVPAETLTESGEPAGETNLLRDYGWAGVLVLLVLLAGGVWIFWKRFQKRQAVVTVEGKAVLESRTQVRRHISVEEKKWEERQVYFHVEGQREEIPVVIRKSMIVGRASTCELIFDDPALSRQHFAIELDGGNLMIRNLSQSGYTEVNGNRLGTGAYTLRPGDEIGAGRLRLTIRW